MNKKIMIFLLFVSFLIIGSFGIVIYYYYNSVDIAIENKAESFIELAHSKKSQIEIYLNGEIERGESFVYQPIYRDFLKMNKNHSDYIEKYKEVEENIDGIVDRFDYLELDLWDTQGIVLVSSTEELLGFNYSELDFFKKGSEGVYMDLFYNPTPGIERKTLGITIPIFDEGSGGLLGIFAISMSLEEFNKIPLSRIGLGDTGQMYVINRDKLIVTSSRFFPEEESSVNIRMDTGQADLCIEDALDKYEPSQIVYKNHENVDVVGVYEHIPIIGGCVIVEMDKSEAIGKIKKDFIELGILILIVATFLMVIFILLTKRILSKIPKN